MDEGSGVEELARSSNFLLFHREGFNRFLVQSPLVVNKSARKVDRDVAAADYQVPYGSYHQLYRLNGKLIAVSFLANH